MRIPRTPLTIYGISFAALVGAVLLRLALEPVMRGALPLVTLFGAVAVAVWAGGYRPAIMVALLGYVACAYLIIEPTGTLGFERVGTVIGFVAYLGTCGLIIGFGEATRRAQQRTRERSELLRVTLASIGDAVITTDRNARVTYLNSEAERLTGWSTADAMGRPLEAIFRIVNEETRAPVENPALRGSLRMGTVVGLANHTVLLAKDGVERPIDDSAAPITDAAGQVSGCVLVFRDVGARRDLEREGVEQLMSARLLASIVESSDDAIVRKSLDGIIQSWNAGAQELFGYRPEEAVGRHISLIIPSERRSEEDEIIAKLRAGDRVDHFETWRVRKDGTLVWVSLTISPIRDAEGRVVAASKIVRDVTRQRQAEDRERQLLENAAQSDAKFRAVFDQSSVFAGILDLTGVILEANRLSWEACGYPREQAMGMPFWEGPWWKPSPPLAARIEAACQRAAVGQPFQAQLPYYVASGAERMVDFEIVPIRDQTGRVLFLAATGADITDRLRAEADRQHFVTLVENSTDFIGMCDLAGTPFFVNRAGLDLVGLRDMEEARQTNLQDFFFPEDRAMILDRFLPGVREAGHGELEIRFRHFRTGDARWMVYKVVKLTDESGGHIGYATVSQDITRRRRLEDDLRGLAADLSTVDRRKDEFLATLAHELRNPLAPLANTLAVLKRADGDPGVARRAYEMMDRQLGQLIRLVDDLLDLNRITHDRVELRKVPVDLGAVVRQAVESCRPLADPAGHTIHVAPPAEPITLMADPVRLGQIFGNLLNNGCKYTPPGGDLWIGAERRGDEAVVTVRDSGIGIPPDQLDSIFDMFSQVDASIERSQGGLGIGLTLVKRLTEMHGGTVTVSSAGPGRGSEFVVRLPIPRIVAPPEARPAIERATSARSILVVDDNVDSAMSLATLLELTGNRTFVAHDGVEAIRAAENHRPDVVLLDIGLPKLNGYDACRQMREASWGKAMTLIALTGWGQDEDRRKSLEAGFDGHLVKPVEYGTLTELLASLGPKRIG